VFKMLTSKNAPYKIVAVANDAMMTMVLLLLKKVTVC